jgi:hypothetical protein
MALIRHIILTCLVGTSSLAAESPLSAEIIPPIQVKIPVIRAPSPPNTWCTYDVATGKIGIVTVTFSAGYNKMMVDTCVSDTETTEADGTIRISGNGKTTTYYTDYYGGDSLNLSRDMYVNQIFLSSTMLKQGKEVPIFKGSAGSYYRLCDEDRGSHTPINNFHNGTLSTGGRISILSQAADRGYLIYEEHGNGQC